MKKLINVSPFLLLLVPVFVMTLLTLITNSNDNKADEVTVKAAASNSNLTKVSQPFSK